nr:zinc-ribbon domain-containing protein [uncultured Merdimonas sp.]
MKYCVKCGERVGDDVQFCPSCGAKIPKGTEEKRQSYDGQQEEYGYQSASGPEYFRPEDVRQNKAMGVLSYIGVLVLVPLLAGNKQSEYVRFHLNQGAVLFIISAVVNILDEHGFFGVSLFHLVNFGIFSLVLDLLNLILFVMMIVGIVSACRGTRTELPVIGQIKLVK